MIGETDRACGSYPYETGVMLSRDPKPRLRWTPDLHDRFVDAVTKLGGPEKATPKSVMRVMGLKGLTLYHLKSHLQKYRLGKQARRETSTEENKAGNSDGHSYSSPTSSCGHAGNSRENPIAEALKYQIEVQRRLQEQLEVQKKLQMRIEAQGKYLQAILEKAQKSISSSDTNEGVSLDATRAQLTDFNLALSGIMDNMTQVSEDRKIGNMERNISYDDDYNNVHNSAFQVYHGDQDQVDDKKRVKRNDGEDSLHLDLNLRGGSYEFRDLDFQMQAQRR